MNKNIKLCFMTVLIIGIFMTSCHTYLPREKEQKINVVRIYDVEPQDRSNMKLSTYEQYMQMKLKIDAGNPNYKEQEEFKEKVAFIEAVPFMRHEFKMGVFTGVGVSYKEENSNYFVEADMPFESGLQTIKEETGIDIDYVMMGSWEEVFRDLEESKDDSITKIVLFNNSFDESIIRELTSGRYEDLSYMMKDFGLDDEGVYDQTVLNAGVIDGGQYLIPLLYNISGMLEGEKQEITIDELKNESFEYTTAEDFQFDSISYEAFIEKLIREMNVWNTSSNVPLFLSNGFFESEPDLFLMSAGIEWGQYREQYQLFSTLMEYLKTYQKTQVESQQGMSLQEKYVIFLKEVEHADYNDNEIMKSLVFSELEEEILENSSVPFFDYYQIPKVILEKTKYFVESTQAEETAFHSILGLLSYYHAYMDSITLKESGIHYDLGKTQYWPIGILGEEEKYAAQPLCYAAVVDGGDLDLAGRVITKLLEYPWAVEAGISPCIETRIQQIGRWKNTRCVETKVRDISKSEENTYEETVKIAYWSQFSTAVGEIASDFFSEQIYNQVENVVIAEIPDRELLNIWKETLTEAVEDDLSSEEGFEILCQRMDEWYGK